MEDRIKQIIDELNEAEVKHLTHQGYTGPMFLENGRPTEAYLVTSVTKKKYINIDFGTSGAFMVEKATGDIFNIKGYGQINRKKHRGNIFDPALDTQKLHAERWS